MESALVLAPQSTSSTAEWSATPGTGQRASRRETGSSITSSSPGISMSTTRTRSWAAPSRSSLVQVCSVTDGNHEPHLNCKYHTGGAGALPIYWDKDWASPYSCKLVNYQTAHNALVDGEYIDCVEENFKVSIR